MSKTINSPSLEESLGKTGDWRGVGTEGPFLKVEAPQGSVRPRPQGSVLPKVLQQDFHNVIKKRRMLAR